MKNTNYADEFDKYLGINMDGLNEVCYAEELWKKEKKRLQDIKH